MNAKLCKRIRRMIRETNLPPAEIPDVYDLIKSIYKKMKK
jgi:hypothetical protein